MHVRMYICRSCWSEIAEQSSNCPIPIQYTGSAYGQLWSAGLAYGYGQRSNATSITACYHT